MKQLQFLFALFLFPVVTNAQTALPDNPGLAQGSLADILQSITSLAASALAPLAILVIVLAGIMFIVSGGNQDRISGAKRMLGSAIFGLIIALLAWVFVNTIGQTLNVG